MSRGRVIAIALLVAGAAHAQPWTGGGHLKYQLTHGRHSQDDLATQYGDRTPTDHDLDLRLKAERRTGPWEAIVHYEALAVAGDSLETRRAAAFVLPSAGALPVSGLPDDRRRVMDLTHRLTDRDRAAAVHRLDRLSLAWLGDSAVLRIGRQAVSWGNGLAFHPLDIFNPFSPVAIDKEYKGGDDMFYGQWVRPSGDDLQALALGRRDAQSGSLTQAQSSEAVKYHGRMLDIDYDLVVARHYAENVYGVGINRSLGGAIARVDLVVTDLAAGDHASAVVANLDYSWTAWGKNTYGFAEYYRQGLGATDAGDYAAIATANPALAARLARAEVFVLGRDYAALGLQIELAALWNLFQTLIVNLHDASGFYQLRGVHDLRQNLQIQGGLNLPFGGPGSEFGGVATPLPGVTQAPARSIFLRAAFYY